jgi:hypothetical protein
VVWSLVRGVPHPSATAERAAFRDGEQEGDVVIGFLNSGARSSKRHWLTWRPRLVSPRDWT